jgi:hypothetical protein
VTLAEEAGPREYLIAIRSSVELDFFRLPEK